MVTASVLVAALQVSAQVPNNGEFCRADPSVESAATTRTLSERDWKSFAAVAAIRQRAGLEVLPGLAGCPSLKEGASELRRHGGTKSLLRRTGLGAEDYVGIGWALVVADDAAAFGIEPTKAVAANEAFIRSRGDEVGRLLHPR